MSIDSPSLIKDIVISTEDKNLFGHHMHIDHKVHHPWNYEIKTALGYIGSEPYHHAEFNTTDNYQLYILGFVKRAYVAERHNQATYKRFYCDKKDLPELVSPWFINHGYDESLIESELSPEDPYRAAIEHTLKFAPPISTINKKTAKTLTSLLYPQLVQ
jgi:hypothetical protein